MCLWCETVKQLRGQSALLQPRLTAHTDDVADDTDEEYEESVAGKY